jgi:hypothetical protein
MSHEELMLLLTSIQRDVLDTKETSVIGFEQINGRLRACENKVSVLNWAVFVGGFGLVNAVVYLIVRHMTT